MKIVIQSSTTKEYFVGNGRWTKDVAKAKEFSQTVAALMECTHNNLTEVQIVLRFQDPRYNLSLPVRPEKSVS
jgi:hypothetical protein